MKKILLGILLCFFIIGCGKDYETYTQEEKNKMYDIALEQQQKGNNKEMEKIKELINKLEIAYRKGDKTAEVEFFEWRESELRFRPYSNELEGDNIDMTNRKW